MLTMQKVFSALKASKRIFWTTSNQKIRIKDICLKQSLLAKSFELYELAFSLECSGKTRVGGLAGEQSSGGSSAWVATGGHPTPLQPEQHVAVSENTSHWHGNPTAWHIWKQNYSITIT